MEITVIQVSNNKQQRQFIDFSYSHYKDMPNYVPELFIAQKGLLSDSNPFFKHSQTAYFMAYKEGKICGRIAAIYNTVHLNIYKDDTGFFGFFESINDKEVAMALFDAAKDWLANKGLKKITGPVNITTNDSCGILIEGFDKDPAVSMPYNMPYYDELIKSCGFNGIMDLNSYFLNGKKIRESFGNALDRVEANLIKQGIVIRNMKFKNFDDEIAQLRPVYNKTNEHNWGFMPLNEDEFREMAKQLKMITPEKFVLIAEKAGEIIGYLVAVPDMNQAFKKLKRGRLFPFGIFKLLWHKRKIDNSRVIILGVMPEYYNSGLDLLFYQRIKEAVYSEGIMHGEASYVMESNRKMNSIMRKIGGVKNKRYRLYEQEFF